MVFQMGDTVYHIPTCTHGKVSQPGVSGLGGSTYMTIEDEDQTLNFAASGSSFFTFSTPFFGGQFVNPLELMPYIEELRWR